MDPAHSLKSILARIDTSPNRIAAWAALRGTIATTTPLVVLPWLGLAALAHFAVLGALSTSMVDVGGSYRQRLDAMVFNTVTTPLLLIVGTRIGSSWWAAAIVMLAIALSAGLLRAIGPSGIPLGLNGVVAFLIGLELPGPFIPSLNWAAGMTLGGLGTISVLLLFWQIRPYRRLEMEVATAWEATADLIAAVRDGIYEKRATVARRRRERLIRRRHRALREALERARNALGDTRMETDGPGVTLANLFVLVRAASRIAAATLTWAETASKSSASTLTPSDKATLGSVGRELEDTTRAIARILLQGKGSVSLHRMRQALALLTALGATRPSERRPSAQHTLHGELAAFAQALRHLANAEEVVPQLFATSRRSGIVSNLNRVKGVADESALGAIRNQISFRSAIFRHALRVALVASIGTAATLRLMLPHGIWLPMTALVILQPDYGATLTRALHRTGGTLAGAAVAGALLATVHGSIAYEAAIAVLLFLFFLLLRRRYGLAVTFLTPLIILLIGLGGTDPWVDLRDRLIDTLAGAALAIVAGYLLWPQWEHQRLPDRLSAAILANSNYLAAILDAVTNHLPPHSAVGELRRQAEIEAFNAEAAFDRMMSEPRLHRERIARAFAVVTYIQRLCRHTTALAAHFGSVVGLNREMASLQGALRASLDGAAAHLSGSGAAIRRPEFDRPLELLRAALTADGDGSQSSTVAFLLGQVVSDTTSLLFAISSK